LNKFDRAAVLRIAVAILGLGLFGVLLFERNWRRGLLWAAPLYVLGNVWGALWLAYRMPEIMRRLRSDPKT
jgi:hypothetical protein